MNQQAIPVQSRGRYTNGLLTVIALLLGVAVLQNGSGQPVMPESASAAFAQPQRGSGTSKSVPTFNAAAQRKQIINELKVLQRSVASLEKKLSGGLKVTVTNLPRSDGASSGAKK